MSIRLFEPLVEESRQHPNFRTIMRPGNGFALDVLSDWARGFEDRDGKFVEEFQTTFNSAFWELYLYAVFKKYGLAVDFSHARPDFCIPESGLVVEAAVASNAKDEEPEHARRGKEPPPDLNAFNFKSILRLSNSLTEKHKKYTQSYAQLDHVKEQSYVIAVTSFDRPFSFVACQRPIEAVLHGYYVDEERHIATNGREGRLEGEQLQRVFKDNGSPVELGLFSSPAYSEISAVIFSSCATFGKVRALSSDPNPNITFTAVRYSTAGIQHQIVREPKHRYTESLVDGLRVYHNPFASHPLDPALFRHPSVFQSYYQNDDWVYEARQGQLMFRSDVVQEPHGTHSSHTG